VSYSLESSYTCIVILRIELKTLQLYVFNTLLRASRNPIEFAYGCLKARWQILNRTFNMKLDNVPLLIYACFVLHNFCEQNDMRMANDLVQRQVEHDKQVQPEIAPDRIFSYNSADGERVRNVITAYIKEHLKDN